MQTIKLPGFGGTVVTDGTVKQLGPGTNWYRSCDRLKVTNDNTCLL